MIFMTVAVCGLFLCLSYVFRGSITLNEVIKNQRTAHKLVQRNCRKECLSEDCLYAATYLLQSVDQAVDPCENFYSFACGKWTERIGKYENHSTLDSMKSNIKISLANLVDSLRNSKDDLAVKLITEFDSCMSFNGSEINVNPTVSIFFKSLGLEDWPNLADDFRFTTPPLEEVFAILSTYGEFSFFLFGSRKRDTNSSLCLPDCKDEIGMSNGAPLVENATHIDLYDDVIKKILTYFNLDCDEQTKILERFKSFDSKFHKFLLGEMEYEAANMSKNETDSTQLPPSYQTKIYENATAQNYDYEGISICSPEIPENVAFICRILKHFLKHSELEGKFSSYEVISTEKNILFGFQKFFSNFDHKTLANYLVLRFFIKHFKEMNVFYRSTAMPKVDDDLITYRSFLSTSQSRKEYCGASLAVFMSEPMAAIYLYEMWPKEEAEDITSIIDEVKEKLKKYSLQQEWLEESEKEKFIEFIDDTVVNQDQTYESMRNLSGFMDDFYPSGDNFFWNILELQRVRSKYFLLKFILGNGITEGYFDVQATYDVKVSFEKQFHRILMRFGILHPPIYKFSLPRLINLANLGFLILHELGHGITFFKVNTQGIGTNNKFNDISDCIREQYSGFFMESINKSADGKHTFRENIADVIAVQIMDKLLEELIQNNDESLQMKLPSLPFSAQQLMYISLVQGFCESRSVELEEELYAVDDHSNGYVRVNGIAKNSEGFKKAFNCKPGSNTSPLEKCSVYN